MIAYKWVIKKDGKYFPLRNFGIDGGTKLQSHPLYKIGYTYKINKSIEELINPDKMRGFKEPAKDGCQVLGFQVPGYHFWKEPKNYLWDKWNRFLIERVGPKLGFNEQINCILICEVNDIIKENDKRLICREFTVIGELTPKTITQSAPEVIV